MNGQQSDEVADEETGMQTTDINNPSIKIKLKRTDTQEIKDEKDAMPDEDGEEEGTGGGNGGGENPGPTPPGPKDKVNVRPTDDEVDSKLFLDINLKVVAKREEEKLFHSLIINSPKDVQNAEIELMVGADNERDDGISLAISDNGNIYDNVLKNVQLSKGRNIIKVSFSDNVKHSVKVKAYEIQ